MHCITHTYINTLYYDAYYNPSSIRVLCIVLSTGKFAY